MTKLFLLYACDEWKGKSKVILVTSSLDRLKEAIQECISKNEMEYSDGDYEGKSAEEQLAIFERDWKEASNTEINSRIRYGYFHSVYDGEFI